MSKNCLVTKLKGVASSPELRKVGELRFHCTAVDSFGVQTSAAGLVAKILTDGVTFTNGIFSGQTEQTWNTPGDSGERTASVSAACEISFNNKYILRRLVDNTGTMKCDISEFEYTQSLVAFACRGINPEAFSFGDISSFKHSTLLETLSILSPEVFGELSDLPIAPFTSLTLGHATTDSEHSNVSGDISVIPSKSLLFTNLSLNNTKVSGDVTSLSSLRSLTTFRIRNTAIRGSLNSFLDAMYNSGNGRTSGTLDIYAQGSNVQYNGVAITEKLTATFSPSGWSVA